MTQSKQLKDIAVGDRVWVCSSISHKPERIQTVARLTPTLIILDGHYTGGASCEFNRYHRGKKSRYSDHLSYSQTSNLSWRSEILSIATADECAKWDAKQAAKAEADAAFQRERKAKEEKRNELSALFSDHINVSESGDSWDVTVYGLTEEQVKRLAAILNESDWLGD